MLEAVKPEGTEIPYEHRLTTGDPANTIVREAEAEKVDFVVMSTHGRTGLDRLLMRVKLAHAQNVLDALATGDFEKLSKDAHRLKLLSQEAAWKVIQTPQYRQHSSEFRHATDELSAAAKNKSLDGAVLAYFGLTMKCVNCHKYVRQVQP